MGRLLRSIIGSIWWILGSSGLTQTLSPSIATWTPFATPTSPLSLDLTLTHHLRDEEPEPSEVCARFEIEPLRTWYYHISPNSHTLVILLQINPASGDESKIVCEGCYETKDISIFAWSSIPGVGHYRWLRGPIHQLPPNSKADYLIRTI